MPDVARPLEFDRDVALRRACRLFWASGYAATSTADLTEAMGIGRQSLYNTFGDKHALYLEALRTYHEETLAQHLARLDEPTSPVEGIRQLLAGVAASDDDTRTLGCFGVTSVNELGRSEPEVLRLAEHTTRRLQERVAERLREGQAAGQFGRALDLDRACELVLTTMTGLQVAARAGADGASIGRSADFVIGLLTRP